MTKITQREIKDIKKTYKKKYNQEMDDETKRILEYGATRLAEIFYEQIIYNAEQREKTKKS